MAVGIENPVIGYLGFTAIKFTGYTLFAKHINNNVELKKNIAGVGVTRTIIGMVFGALYWIVLSTGLSISDSTTPIAYFGGLLLVRYFEWYLLLKIFYSELFIKKKHNGYIVKGIVVSYILDIPAAIGFIATAGFWVC